MLSRCWRRRSFSFSRPPSLRSPLVLHFSPFLSSSLWHLMLHKGAYMATHDKSRTTALELIFLKCSSKREHFPLYALEGSKVPRPHTPFFQSGAHIHTTDKHLLGADYHRALPYCFNHPQPPEGTQALCIDGRLHRDGNRRTVVPLVLLHTLWCS